MSNPTVTVSFSNPDPSTTITDFPDLVTQLNTLITGAIEGEFVPYITSDSTPAVSDQDKVWIQVDAAGRPLYIKKFYGGAWRRVYDGNSSEVRIFIGDPAAHFDGTGLGIVGGDWDGWQIMNGQNGTPNWSNLFICAGQMDNTGTTGYSAGWQSNVTGAALHGGGNANVTLVNNNLPTMKVQLAGKGGYDDNASPSVDKEAIVTGKWVGNASNVIDITTFGADPNGSPAVPQVAVPTVPPFAAVCFVEFVGYA